MEDHATNAATIRKEQNGADTTRVATSIFCFPPPLGETLYRDIVRDDHFAHKFRG